MARQKVESLFFCYTKLSSCHRKKVLFIFFILSLGKSSLILKNEKNFSLRATKNKNREATLGRMLVFSCFAGTSSDKDQHILSILMGNQVSKQESQNETLNSEMIGMEMRLKKALKRDKKDIIVDQRGLRWNCFKFYWLEKVQTENLKVCRDCLLVYGWRESSKA